MDPTAIAGMLFVLLLAAMLGGFILLFPISRRLGALLEERLGDRKKSPQLAEEQIRQLRDSVQALQGQIEELSERQVFTESLLAERRPPALPASGEPGS